MPRLAGQHWEQCTTVRSRPSPRSSSHLQDEPLSVRVFQPLRGVHQLAITTTNACGQEQGVACKENGSVEESSGNHNRVLALAVHRGPKRVAPLLRLLPPGNRRLAVQAFKKPSLSMAQHLQPWLRSALCP